MELKIPGIHIGNYYIKDGKAYVDLHINTHRLEFWFWWASQTNMKISIKGVQLKSAICDAVKYLIAIYMWLKAITRGTSNENV